MSDTTLALSHEQAVPIDYFAGRNVRQIAYVMARLRIVNIIDKRITLRNLDVINRIFSSNVNIAFLAPFNVRLLI